MQYLFKYTNNQTDKHLSQTPKKKKENNNMKNYAKTLNVKQT